MTIATVQDVKEILVAARLCSYYEIDDPRKILIDITEETEWNVGKDENGEDIIEKEETIACHWELVDQLFPFKYEYHPVPESAREEGEGLLYYIYGSIRIPELVPLLDKIDKARIKFNRRGPCDHSLEMVYLPHSMWATHEDEEIRNWASQEGTFILAIQDEGYHKYDDYLNFYLEAKAVCLYIHNFIEKHKQTEEPAEERLVAAA